MTLRKTCSVPMISGLSSKRLWLRGLALMLLVVASATCVSASVDSTAMCCEAPECVEACDSNFWIHRIRQHNYDIKDTTIVYPKFLKFCVNAYNWGDRTFNTYNPDFVEGTGKKWKVMLKSDNWNDSYAMDFKGHIPVRMLSNVYTNVGAYLSFMAVSVGYSINVGNLFFHRPAHQKKFEFNFNTSLFTVDAYYSSNTGGTILRQLGNYNDGHWFHYPFSDLTLESYGADAYYFFNHMCYSQGAVYNYSKYQRKSAGSFIVGVTAAHQTIKINFENLPEGMLSYLPGDSRRYNFIYNDFCILAGYGYNWVFHPKWVLNITVLPTFGFKHSFAESSDGRRDIVSLNLKARGGVTYNHRNFFVGVAARTDGHWYLNKNYSFFNFISNFGATSGFRF